MATRSRELLCQTADVSSRGRSSVAGNISGPEKSGAPVQSKWIDRTKRTDRRSPEMKSPYDDIIHLPHHVSQNHPQMPMLDRAAQFAPFAALTGCEAAVGETARLTAERREPDVLPSTPPSLDTSHPNSSRTRLRRNSNNGFLTRCYPRCPPLVFMTASCIPAILRICRHQHVLNP